MNYNKPMKKILPLLTLTLLMLFQKSNAMECKISQSKDLPEKFSISIDFSNTEDFVNSLPKDSFLKVKYDSSKMKYKNTSFDGFLKHGYTKVEKDVHKYSSALNVSFKKEKIRNRLGNASIKVEFETKDKIFSSNSEIILSLANKTSEEEKVLDSFTVSMEDNPEVAKCKLINLSPSEGKLTPSFNPDITEYNLNVSGDTKSIDFNTYPENDSLNVKVSRKKLFAPGKTTVVKIFVSNPWIKGLKKTYTVKVNRDTNVTDKKKEVKSSVRIKNKIKSKYSKINTSASNKNSSKTRENTSFKNTKEEQKVKNENFVYENSEEFENEEDEEEEDDNENDEKNDFDPDEEFLNLASGTLKTSNIQNLKENEKSSVLNSGESVTCIAVILLFFLISSAVAFFVIKNHKSNENVK